jgi:hypothetical protein
MNRIRCLHGLCGGRGRCARLVDHHHRSRQPRPGAPTRQDADHVGIAEYEPIIAEPNALAHESIVYLPQAASRKPPCLPETLPALNPDQPPPEHPGWEHQAQPLRLSEQARRNPATALINTGADSGRSEINGQAIAQ